MFEKIILKKINEHVYLMDDNHESTAYLVVGSKKALVIDTTYDDEDLHAVVRSITDLPLMVVNTHGHCDHIFGNVFFDKAYFNEADLAIYSKHTNFPDFRERCEKNGYKMPPMGFIGEGETIDLGGLTVRVYELFGHTPGGLMFLLVEDRILFTGDSINHHLWMQLEESAPMAEFVKNLEAKMFLEKEADYILFGHGQGLDDISLMRKVLNGAKEIVEGKTDEDLPYEWFGGLDKQHKFDEDGSVICYREMNIK